MHIGGSGCIGAGPVSERPIQGEVNDKESVAPLYRRNQGSPNRICVEVSKPLRLALLMQHNLSPATDLPLKWAPKREKDSRQIAASPFVLRSTGGGS